MIEMLFQAVAVALFIVLPLFAIAASFLSNRLIHSSEVHHYLHDAGRSAETLDAGDVLGDQPVALPRAA